MTTQQRDMQQHITDKIIAELEAGSLPWVKEWVSAGYPVNAITGRRYSGINALILWMIAGDNAYAKGQWCTFQQAKQTGHFVKKGETGAQVVFYKPLTKELDNVETGNKEQITIPMTKWYSVFNVAQIEGMDALPGDSNASQISVDEFITATGVKMESGSPAYIPSMDYLNMPRLEAFISADAYYATVFHELIHWTGAKHRTGRDMSGRFGDEAYAMEELVAEIGAAFLCAEFGIKGEIRHAGYIEGWLKVLKSDKKAIFAAAAKASQAVEYLLSLGELETVKTEQHQTA